MVARAPMGTILTVRASARGTLARAFARGSARAPARGTTITAPRAQRGTTISTIYSI